MKTRRMWPVYALLAVALLLSMAFLVPKVSIANPGGGGPEPVDAAQLEDGQAQLDGQAGICVTGQVIDEQHAGIPGVTVSASGPDNMSTSMVSGKNGRFAFTGFTPGTWTFRVEVPNLWQAVTPAEFTLDLAYGRGSCYPIRFKLAPRGCLIVHKQDTRENPLQGWKISLSGAVQDTGITDASGNTTFNELPPGKYKVSEEVPYPWQATTPATQVVDVPAAQAGTECARVTFTNQERPTACVTGTKVNDQHVGQGGWVIIAKPVNGGAPTFQTSTAPDGAFTFPNLTLGTWRLYEQVQPGWQPITPPSFEVTLTEPGSPPDCTTVRFKNRAPDLCAEGFKVDENGRPLSGWTINAYPASDPTKVMTATTNAQGYYRFINLTQESWTFAEQHQTGWTALSGDQFDVDIVPGERCTRVPVFRNRSPRGCIDGYKRDDLQVGLPGWNISIAGPKGGINQRRETDGTGYFRFDNLPTGDYWVYEEMQRGWAAVSPPKVQATVEASDENRCTTVTFVNRQIPRDICIDGYKLDVFGRVGLPGFTITAALVGGDVNLTQQTDGVGYFRFGNLQPGTYKVSVDELPGWVPVGPRTLTVTVDWPPRLQCSRVKFFDKQGTPPKGGEFPTDGEQPPGDGEEYGPLPPGCSSWYTVKEGDTLGNIGAKYGTNARSLMLLNGIKSASKIQPGQHICLP